MTELTSPCIIPALVPDKLGYNKASFNGKTVLKHRLEYCRYHHVTLLSIKGKIVMHRCDNRGCVNPEHLELGTQSKNIQDMHDRGRFIFTENRAKGTTVNTAKLTEEQVLEIWNDKHTLVTVLGKRYGVAHNTILAIRNGRTWKHLTQKGKQSTEITT